MSKVIDNNDIWYHEVAPRSYYSEEDLERSIIQNLQIIFPDYKAFPFKKPLKDRATNQTNTPDLAMVKKDYSEWYIIEVELGKHTKSHVIEQMKTFYNCSYLDEHAIYMNSQRNDFDLVKLKKMVATNPPEFMVIVNEPKPDWAIELKKLNCKACIFQIYHDYLGNTIYRLNGEHPYIEIDFCHCRYQKTLPYVVEILDNVSMLDKHSILDGVLFDVEFNGKIFQWKRQDDAGRVFLQSDNPRPPLDPLRSSYRLNYNQILLKKPSERKWFYKFMQWLKIYKSDPTFLITFSFKKD